MSDPENDQLAQADESLQSVMIHGEFVENVGTVSTAGFSSVLLNGRFNEESTVVPFGLMTLKSSDAVLFNETLALDNIAFLIAALAGNMGETIENLHKLSGRGVPIFWPVKAQSTEWLRAASKSLRSAADQLDGLETLNANVLHTE